MSLKKRDALFVLLIIVVLGIFIAITGKEKTKKLPKDSIHAPFAQMRAEGKAKIEVDALCAKCHDGVQIPFPEKHPAKPGAGVMRCLFCHKVDTSK